MLPAGIFSRLMLLLPFNYSAPNNGNSNNNHDKHAGEVEWSYSDKDNWGDDYPICDGYRQSPIPVRTVRSILTPLLLLFFDNYNIPLVGPLKLVNNGHTANMDIPVTKTGKRPTLSGGRLYNDYEAVSLHFHWGSRNSKGSEHMIGNKRFDAEMHIVHKNIRYATVDEARQRRDGLAVLGIMLEKVHHRITRHQGLKRILNRLPDIIEYESEATVNGPLTLRQILGDLDTTEYFTYKGSLTTPPCSEAVTWFIFPEPLAVAAPQIAKFWDLLDSLDGLLRNNYRPLQPVDGRKILHKILI